jgi:hypothetical protein
MTEYEVGEIPPEQLEKQKKRYGLEDFVKGRVDDETLDRIARNADKLQRENLGKARCEELQKEANMRRAHD